MEIVKRIKLHNGAFAGGTNLQLDLDTEKRTGLRLLDDSQEEVVYVHFKDEIIKMPYTNISSITPTNERQAELADIFTKVFAGEKVEKKNTAPGVRVQAQASSPQDHVFAGPGKGKTK